MHPARLFIALILFIGLAACGADAQPVAAGHGDVFVSWDAQVTGEDLRDLTAQGFDGVVLPAIVITYDKDNGTWKFTGYNLSGLDDGSAMGLDFYIAVRLNYWTGGWSGTPDLLSLAQLASDVTRSAALKIDDAGGRVLGIAIEPMGTPPALSQIKQILNWMKNGAAFKDMQLAFAVICTPELTAKDGFAALAGACDFIILSLAQPELEGDAPELINEDWAVKSAKAASAYGKPVVVALPMMEKVLQHDKFGRMVNPNLRIGFDTIMEQADSVGTDNAANTTATITRQVEIDGIQFPPGTIFTNLAASPGELADIVKALGKKEAADISMVILDGLPYEPSARGYKPSQYVASLKGAAPSPVETAPSVKTQADQVRLADSKTYVRGTWYIGIGFIVACAIAGLSLLCKRNLKYDEDSGKLIRKGDDE